MRKLTMTMCLLALGAGCSGNADAPNEFEQKLREHAASLGYDPDEGMFDGTNLTVEGDIILGVGHIDPAAPLGYELGDVIGMPREQAEKMSPDEFAQYIQETGIAGEVEKGRFYKSDIAGTRVYDNDPFVKELRVCYWGVSSGDEALGLHFFNLASAINTINGISGTRLKLTWKEGPNCGSGDGYPVKVRRRDPGGECSATYPPEEVNFGGGKWIVPGKEIWIRKTPRPGDMPPCRPPAAGLVHEILHTLGFSHSNRETQGDGTPSFPIGGTSSDTDESIMAVPYDDVTAPTLDDRRSIRRVYPD